MEEADPGTEELKAGSTDTVTDRRPLKLDRGATIASWEIGRVRWEWSTSRAGVAGRRSRSKCCRSTSPMTRKPWLVSARARSRLGCTTPTSFRSSSWPGRRCGVLCMQFIQGSLGQVLTELRWLRKPDDQRHPQLVNEAARTAPYRCAMGASERRQRQPRLITARSPSRQGGRVRECCVRNVRRIDRRCGLVVSVSLLKEAIVPGLPLDGRVLSQRGSDWGASRVGAELRSRARHDSPGHQAVEPAVGHCRHRLGCRFRTRQIRG